MPTTKTKSSKTKSKVKSVALIKETPIDTIRPMIQVRNLVKKYDDFVAIDGISFDVYKGEIFGILGPNGAGKTTTLEVIETVLDKTSGQILIDGLDADIYPQQVKSIIGIQLQSAGFYPKLNLVESLELFANIYNVKIDAMQLLDNVSLTEKAKSYVDDLSGGQKQRFSIASTLVANPDIIFLDEPTTGLDPQARRNLWDMIKKLKSQRKTIVLTTHYMDEAEQLCDRLAVMDQGKIIEINTPRNFIQELLDRGFSKPQIKLQANLEDVFLDLTGREWRD